LFQHKKGVLADTLLMPVEVPKKLTIMKINGGQDDKRSI
jgi:hypothetical protein